MRFCFGADVKAYTHADTVLPLTSAACAWACACVCRWNVVGIQGSLMSYFTEPIYFSSIILGSLYHADHLSRAMYQRIADIEDLPQQFALNRPLLSGQHSCFLIVHKRNIKHKKF